jgi:hypothetical protein
MAVGGSGNSFKDWPDARIILRWNGESWTTASSNTPTYVSYNAVSCVSASNCWAVGSYQDKTFLHFARAIQPTTTP